MCRASKAANHLLDGLLERMEPSIFRYILRHSAKQQIFLLVVILAYYPFLYISLELPKVIVNQAIENKAGGPPFNLIFLD